MGSYLDTSDAEIIALTRRRRAELAQRRELACEAHEGLSFPAIAQTLQDQIEAAWRERDDSWNVFAPHLIWKRDQWKAGNRHCGYCGVRTTRDINTPRTCTVDHRKPRAFGGQEVPENWIIACSECNNRKGLMSEANFRLLLASENTARARRLTA